MKFDYNEIYALVSDVPRTSDEITKAFYQAEWNDNSRKNHINVVLKALIDDGKVLAYHCDIDGKYARRFVLNHGQTVTDEPMMTDRMVSVLKKEQRWMKTDELISMFYGESKCNARFRHIINERLTKAKWKGIESDKFYDVVNWRAIQ